MSGEYFCPICELEYEKGNYAPRRRSKHHVFPKVWYKDSFNIKVYVCQKCHDEFNSMFMEPLDLKNRWSKKECVRNWILFCFIKQRNPYEIYPEL